MTKIFTQFTLIVLCLTVCAIPGNAQSPGGVAGSNTLWLKANTGVTLSATDEVVLWEELSGAAVTGDFSTQGVAINKPAHQPPIFLENGINFNPYIVFNSTATNNSISSANDLNGTQLLDPTLVTIFQVIRLHTTTGTGVWLKWQWSVNPYAGPRLGNEVNSGSNPGCIRFDFRNPQMYSTTNIIDKHVMATEEANANTKSIRLNGQVDASVAANGTFAPGTNTGKITLGAESYGDDYPTEIDIAEMIIYKRSLTVAERNKVETYMAIKYGITLAQTGPDANNYTASDNSIIWNQAANVGYANNITGVGRDDASGLHQKQSLSIHDNHMVTLYAGSPAGVFPATNSVNTQNFGTDLSFVLFGDNHGDTLVNNCSADGRFSRMDRTWKVAVKGNPGTVTLALDMASVPPEITTLIVADDQNFTSNVQYISMQDNGTELYAAANFSSGQYFTFGTEPMVLNATVADVLCEGNNGGVVLAPTGGTAPFTYSWNSSPVQSTQNLSNVSAGNYTVTVTQGNGCSFEESFTIVGSPASTYLSVIDTQNTMCTMANGVISVLGQGGTPSYQYRIDGSAWTNQGYFNILSAGTHYLEVKDANNCQNDTTITLFATTYDLDLETEFQNAWCDAGGLGGAIKVKPSGGTSPYNYFWPTIPNGFNGSNPMNLAKGTYEVTVTDYYGCTGSATITLEEEYCCWVWLPNAFTPNADGLNDEFASICNRSVPNYELSVFNRWGQRIFYTRSYDEGWKGFDQQTGAPVDAGTYYYLVKYTCEMSEQTQEYTGEVTLIR